MSITFRCFEQNSPFTYASVTADSCLGCFLLVERQFILFSWPNSFQKLASDKTVISELFVDILQLFIPIENKIVESLQLWHCCMPAVCDFYDLS